MSAQMKQMEAMANGCNFGKANRYAIGGLCVLLVAGIGYAWQAFGASTARQLAADTDRREISELVVRVDERLAAMSLTLNSIRTKLDQPSPPAQ